MFVTADKVSFNICSTVISWTDYLSKIWNKFKAIIIILQSKNGKANFGYF
jgi:hypothetical protein